MNKRLFALLLCLVMVFMLVPATTWAYVGAMEQNPGGVSVGSEAGYFYLKNDYMNFWIDPASGSTYTLPAHKDLNYAKQNGFTESHLFICNNDSMQIESLSIDNGSGKDFGVFSGNPVLVANYRFTEKPLTARVVYRMVQVDDGQTAGNSSWLLSDSIDDNDNWGILASVTVTLDAGAPYGAYNVLWQTWHNDFGKIGHSEKGSVMLSKYVKEGLYDYPDPVNDTLVHSAVNANFGFPETNSYGNTCGFSEAYTDSFTNANQFVALGQVYSYRSSSGIQNYGIKGYGDDISGYVRGGFAKKFSYSKEWGILSTQQNFDKLDTMFGDTEYSAEELWGFRSLQNKNEVQKYVDEIDPDVYNASDGAACVGIVKDGNTVIVDAPTEQELVSAYGDKLKAVLTGEFHEYPDRYEFTKGGVQLSNTTCATWDATTAGNSFTLFKNGTVKLVGKISLSCPTFMFYSPNTTGGLGITFTNDGVQMNMESGTNNATLNSNVPYVSSLVDKAIAKRNGELTISGKMKIDSTVLTNWEVDMQRMEMAYINDVYKVKGLEAKGGMDTNKLFGLNIADIKADINTFEGQKHYNFDLSIKVFSYFNCKATLHLQQIKTGELIPDELYFKIGGKPGIPLGAPPIGYLTGGGGGFSGLAATMNDGGEFPPLRIKLEATGNIAETVSGRAKLTLGMGYWDLSLTDGKLWGKVPLGGGFRWYTEIGGASKTYNGTAYNGYLTRGGLVMDVSIPSESYPFIKSNASIETSVFVGESGSKGYIGVTADGRIMGTVQIPKEVWSLGDFKLFSTDLQASVGGDATYNLSMAHSDIIDSLDVYGAVAYTGSLLGVDFRVSYISSTDKIRLQTAGWFSELDEWNPGTGSSTLSLKNSAGQQVALLGMSTGLRPLTFSTTAATTCDVTTTGKALITLKPTLGGTATIDKFYNEMSVTNLTLVKATYDAAGVITNPGAANAVVGDDYVSICLPDANTRTISSTTIPFVYELNAVTPLMKFSGSPSMTSTKFTDTLTAYDSGSYLLRLYLGNAQGGTDYLLSESSINSKNVNQPITLSGTAAPTGSYYLTAVLLQNVTSTYEGKTITIGVPLDSYAGTSVNYTNNALLPAPVGVTLADTGNETLTATWGKVTNAVGYKVSIYEMSGTNWVDANAGYLLEANDSALDYNSTTNQYSLRMALSVGGTGLALPTGKSYRVGVSAFTGAIDKPVIGNEEQSSDAGVQLNEFTPLTLTFTGNSSVGVNQNTATGETSVSYGAGKTDGKLYVDFTKEPSGHSYEVKAYRIDTDTEIPLGASTDKYALELSDAPTGTQLNFTGSLTVRYEVHETNTSSGVTNVTTAFVQLQRDNTPPIVNFDRQVFYANAGNFTITGVTEPFATISIAGGATSTADSTGKFAITGMSGSAIEKVELTIKDPAGNESTATTMVSEIPANYLSVTGVSLDRATLTLSSGNSYTLTATVAPSGATNAAVNWYSSNPAVATVDANGKVTAVGAGTATISAVSADNSTLFARCDVTVNARRSYTVAGLAILAPVTDTTITVVKDNTATLAVSAQGATRYQWQINRGKGWVTITGATLPHYITSELKRYNNGYQYRCLVSDGATTLYSPVYTLNVVNDLNIPDTGNDYTPVVLLAFTLLCGTALAAKQAITKRRGKNHEA